jgi:hypothetical protein
MGSDRLRDHAWPASDVVARARARTHTWLRSMAASMLARMAALVRETTVGNGRGRGCGVVANVREMLLLIGKLGRHHLRLHAFMSTRRGAVAVLFLVIIISTVEIGGTFVLLRTTVILISGNKITHVCRRVLVQLLIVAEDENGNIDGAQDGKLVCLLEQAALTLKECDRTIAVILDGLDFDLSATHLDEDFGPRGSLEACEIVENGQRYGEALWRPCAATRAREEFDWMLKGNTAVCLHSVFQSEAQGRPLGPCRSKYKRQRLRTIYPTSSWAEKRNGIYPGGGVEMGDEGY